jgi:sulfide:quinone oxidoreductase
VPARIVILGAGFGGLELSTRLSDELGDDVAVTLIDKSDAFVFGFSKLDVLFGRRTPDEVRLHYRDIVKPGVEFRQETIRSIDPENKRVVTDASTYEADVLVVALGADLDPDATPGLAEGGYEFYSPAGAERLRDVLTTFDGGVVVVGVLGGFFKCPPAPFETAFMMHDYLSSRGLRDESQIHVVSPLPMPIPISKEVSAEILAMGEDRKIEHWPGTGVSHLDPARKVAHVRDGRELAYDLFLGIPVHRSPAVVSESPLAGDGGFIPVDHTAAFATKFPDVYAVGDVTLAPVPRAGVFAEGEAAVVADALIAQIKGGSPPAPWQGVATCYMETGEEKVSKVNVSFLGGPSPTAVFQGASSEWADEKRDFGASRRRRWFGHDA